MKKNFLLLLASLGVFMFAACSADSSCSVAPESSSSAKGDAPSSSNSQGAVSLDDPNEMFSLRKPTSKKLAYEDDFGEKGEEEFDQQDWVCSFNYDGEEGYFYIQSTPVDVMVLMNAMPIYETDKAEMVIGGKKVEVKNPEYDWGGNHHNDKITFTYGGKIFSYYHSSFGFGWRSCQEMDCMQVFNADGDDIKDGCTSKRELPVICRQVNAEGKIENFKDSFEKCLGDEE